MQCHCDILNVHLIAFILHRENIHIHGNNTRRDVQTLLVLFEDMNRKAGCFKEIKNS